MKTSSPEFTKPEQSETGRDPAAFKRIEDWLSEVDAMPLECDGASRVVSTLLAREGLAHEVRIGSLTVVGCGHIPVHWWVELTDGVVIDFRARMWLGQHPVVPHGVFLPDGRQQYSCEGARGATILTLSAQVFHVLAGKPVDAYPRLRGPLPPSWVSRRRQAGVR